MEVGMKSFGRVALVWRVMFRRMCVVVRREGMGILGVHILCEVDMENQVLRIVNDIIGDLPNPVELEVISKRVQQG
jgi:hypothetical protein